MASSLARTKQTTRRPLHPDPIDVKALDEKPEDNNDDNDGENGEGEIDEKADRKHNVPRTFIRYRRC